MTDEFLPQGDPAAPTHGPAPDLPAEPVEISEFIEDPYAVVEVSRVEVAIDDVPQDAAPCWYCGLGEAALWFGGTLGVHLAGGIFAVIVTVVTIMLMTGKQPTRMEDPQVMLPVTSIEMSLFVLAAVLAVGLRFWGRTLDELNFSRPDLRHVLIVVLATIPLSLCVGMWSIPIQACWKHIAEMYPALKFFDGLNSMEAVKEMSQSTSFLVMVLIVGVTPAIGEELVFRGAIGRVLIANLGIWAGVIVTSFLFAWIHIHPVHAMAVIPLGFAIHLIYLWTKSFWMPMLLHFLNNSWAVYATQIQKGDPTDKVGHLSTLDIVELASGVLAAVFLVIALWQSRTRYFESNGQEWCSLRFPVRVPRGVEIERRTGRISPVCWIGGIVCSLVCHVAVVIDLAAPAVEAN
jgi:membrane protease YdiL (CAAX protease family)